MVDYKKLKQIREETGVSFSLCKKALEETKNNIEASKKKLSEWGAEKIVEKAARSTSQGAIFCYVHHNKKIASLIELQCETDFVARNNDFLKLGQELAMQASCMPATGVESFLLQEYIRDPGKKVCDLLKEAIFKFGENIKIARLARWELGR
ncbi:MAG: elongation factor Ts [Candidatus Roizmanbacteria bacterium]|nr:MAG: elongation factor Ts [Candidatus Roizmanbacteria bacterium]